MNNKFKHFTMFGKRYFFTNIFDNISSYNFGGRVYSNGVLTEDNRSYWHKVAFGVYRKSDSWLC